MSRPRTKNSPHTADSSSSSPTSSAQARPGLTDARNSKGLSQQALADLLGTTHVNVSRWERGITRPTPYFRAKLTKILGKSEGELDLIPLIQEIDETLPSSSLPDASALSTSTRPSSSINSNILNTQKSAEDISNSQELLDTREKFIVTQAVRDATIPHAPIKPLIGRETELAEVKQRLTVGGDAALTALNGLPGVGKTALSITIANDKEVQAHFHDGILWAALGPAPDLTGILSRWSKLLGIPDAKLAELSDLYAWAETLNHAIGLRTILIVIDDAWELDHALPLRVGGPNCAHLLTTRFPDIAREFVKEAEITTLHELDDEQSLELLLRLAPTVIQGNEERAHGLIRAVGGLPLALTLVGNYLKHEGSSLSSRRIRDAFSHLDDAAARMSLNISNDYVKGHPSLKKGEHISLQTLFAVTDQRLTESQRAALYALSILPSKPGDFSEEAALAIAQCKPSDLDALHDTGLLESKDQDRYTLHQTIADYAHLKLNERGEKLAVQDRLITYALRTILDHRKDYEILEREQGVILHALNTAYSLNRSSELIQGATAFTPFLLLRALYDHAHTHLTRAHQLALAAHDERGIASTHLYLGELDLRQSHFNEANEQLGKGLKLARSLNSTELTCDLLDKLGVVAWKFGKYAEAYDYFEEGLILARQLDDIERICNLLKSLDLVMDSMGKSEQGRAYLREGVELARRAGNREQLCTMLINLGVSVSGEGNYTLAEHYFQEGLDIAKAIGHKEWVGAILSNLGDMASEQGDYRQAEDYFHEGLRVAQQIGNYEWLSVLLINLGTITRKQGNYRQAEDYLKRGLAIAYEIAIPHITCNGLYEYGMLALQEHDLALAEARFQEMWNLVPKDDQELRGLASYGIAQVAAQRGKLSSAIRLATDSIKQLRAVGNRKADEIEQWMEASLRIAC